MIGADGDPPVTPARLSYAEASAELDAIIAEFDQGQVDVDRLGERFQRATELVEELDLRIRANRKKVDGLSPRLDAVARGAEETPDHLTEPSPSEPRSALSPHGPDEQPPRPAR